MYVIWPLVHDCNFRFEFHAATGNKLKGKVVANKELLMTKVWDELIDNKAMKKLSANKTFGSDVVFSGAIPEGWED